MLYGNAYTGYGYSPDRSRDVNRDNLRSQFIGASGSRQTGYYYSPSRSNPSTTQSGGYYDGAGRYHRN